MNSTFRFLSLLLLVLIAKQISFATEPAEALARKAISENSGAAIEELRALGLFSPEVYTALDNGGIVKP